MTVRDDQIKESLSERGVWIVIAFVLLGIEITVSYNDRAKLDQQQAKTLREERESFGSMLEQERQNFKQERDTYAMVHSWMQGETERKQYAARLKTEQPKSRAEADKATQLPAGNLKREALSLAADIFTFLSNRQAAESPFPPRGQQMIPGYMDKWKASQSAYLEETMSLYDRQLGERVKRLREALSRQGISNAQLDEWSEHPTNIFGLETLARVLQEVAEKLPG